MASTDLLMRSDEDGVAQLTLNAPQTINALSEAMLAALSEELDQIAADHSVKAVMLRSAGAHFCAGHNLKEMTARRADPGEFDSSNFSMDSIGEFDFRCAPIGLVFAEGFVSGN